MGTLRVSEIKSTTESPLVISSDISISGTLLVSGETTFNFVGNNSATTITDFWVDNLNTNDYALKVQNNLTVKESTTLGNLYMDGEILTPSFYGTEEDLYVTKNLNVENDINVTNDLNVSNDLNVTNDLNVSNDLNVVNNITANGSVSATHLYGDGSNITNLPVQNVIKETFGYDSITQNSNLTDYFNLGSNTSSLGDFNKSNGDYSQSFGISNTTGVDSKIFTLGDTKMHLIIFDDIDDVFLNFNTGNTITGTTYYTATTGTTTVGLTSTTITVSILTGNTNQCLNYKVRNLNTNTGATISYIDCCGISKTLILSGYSRNYQDICSIVTPTSNISSVEIRQECAGEGYYGCKKWFYNNLNSFPVRIYFYNCNNKYTSLVLPPSTSGYTTSCIKGTPYNKTSIPINTLFLLPTGECCSNCVTSTAVINTTTIISGITTITQVVKVPINPPYTSGCTQYLITNNAYNRVRLEIGNCDTGTFSSTTIPSYSQRCIWSSVPPILINEPWMSAYTAQFLYITSGSGTTLPCTTYSAQVITTTAITYTSITTQVTACTSYVSGFTTTTVLTGKTDEEVDIEIISPLRVGNITLHDNKGGTYIGVITDIFTGMTSGTTITGMTVSGVTNILTNLVGGEMRKYAILTLKEELPRIGSYGYAVNSLKGRGSIASGINTKAEGVGSQSGGLYSKTTQTGEFARSSGMFSSVGDSQYSILSLMGITSGNTTSNMYVDGISENIKIPKNSIVGITLQANTIIEKDNSGKDEKGGAMFFKDNILIHNNNNVTTIFSGTQIVNVSTSTNTLTNARIDFVVGNTYTNYTEINVNITGISDLVLRWGGMVTMTKLSI